MEIEAARPRCFEDVIGRWERAGLTRPWNDPDADLRRAVEGSSSTVLVGMSDGRLVATVMVAHDGHRGWVYYLAVSPDEQRKGRGRTMMAAAESWLRERGVPKLNLMVRYDNEAGAASTLCCIASHRQRSGPRASASRSTRRD